MGIGTSIFLIAVGAILTFAVDVTTNGFNINTIGIILMLVGGLGLVVSAMFWDSWGGFGRTERTVVTDGAAPTTRRRTTVTEDRVA